MRHGICGLVLLAAIFLWGTSLFVPCAKAGDPSVKELLDRAGIKPKGDQRGQMDTVGFVTTARQMDNVMTQCNELAAPRHKTLEDQYGWTSETAFIAGVCPHDDYYYAGRLYPLLLSHVKAKTVILFGVFHKARVFDHKDRLVFDSYKTWRGPYGPVNVAPLRDEIIGQLPDEDYVVNNDMQMVEHSVEAIVPWLQAYNRNVEIISILVPYMTWETMDRLAADLSTALEKILRAKKWRLGEDVCLIASADAVHYGDSGWGGSSYAEFGTDVVGYQRAVERDLSLARNHLSGPVDRDHLKEFLYTCVDRNDVMTYRVTWCGRFSVSFGLNVASRLTEAMEDRQLEGRILDYGTSVSEASLDTKDLDGLGSTAPNNFRHFVGYAAIGYE
ncbi:MAG: AmmeMemoRadiSam system protein B [Candidatus Latescibacterota bacterium]|nr:MAG: AmmeMemoRadiSam system protein B [Candidatus Latescibacterota bacterium]